MNEKLPLPFAACLAMTVSSKFKEDGTLVNPPTADDEDRMGNTTYTDD